MSARSGAEPRDSVGRARPRAGLLGNPSDLYGGAVLAFTFEDFATEVTAERALRLELVDERGEVRRASGALEPRALDGGAELLAAAAARFAARFPELALGRGERVGLRLSFRSDVPRQAGLSGSSAIVIAALRSLAAAHERALAPFELAELALAAEVEELGLVAGPQDRLVQAYEGLLAMDLAPPRAPEKIERLDPALLPPLLVAWEREAGRPSGAIHDQVYRRWLAGDARVAGVMGELRALALAGRDALARGDHATVAGLVDRNFDLRASLFPIAPRDREMIELARARGAAAKFCGSGGSALCLPRPGSDAGELEAALRAAGFGCLRPRIGGSTP